MPKPVVVVISDIHFTPTALELASKALMQALDKASELKVPLIVNGDTLDTKAIIRGECSNRLISILQDYPQVFVFFNTGNHDLLSEKGKESALNFLSPYATVVSCAVEIIPNCYMIPYQNSPEAMLSILSEIPKGSTLFVHQGIHGSNMGHYVQDKSALSKEAFADFRTISGHYHMRQDIKCGRPRKGAIGLFSYVGNPYTQNFGEAGDPEKGFQVLMDDGSLQFVPTNLRQHVVAEIVAGTDTNTLREICRPEDLLWLKVTGTHSQLAGVDKQKLAEVLPVKGFKLDKIPTDSPKLNDKLNDKKLSQSEMLDAIIDNMAETSEQKAYLKTLWRELV